MSQKKPDYFLTQSYKITLGVQRALLLVITQDPRLIEQPLSWILPVANAEEKGLLGSATTSAHILLATTMSHDLTSLGGQRSAILLW